MTLLYMNSMVGASTFTDAAKGFVALEGAEFTSSGGAGAADLPYFTVNNTTDNAVVPLSSSPSTVFFSCWAFTRQNDIGTTTGFINIREHSTTHVSIHAFGGGSFIARQSDSGGALAGASNRPSDSVPTNKWFHLEGKIIIHNSAGEVTLKVNGEQVINITGVDTQQGGTGVITDLVFKGSAAGDADRVWNVTNIAVWDTTGSILNGFIGVRKVISLVPDGGGGVAQFSRSSTTSTNWELVDDLPQDNSDNVFENSTGIRDRYTVTNFPTTLLTVHALQATTHLRKTDGNSLYLESFIESTGSENASTSIGFSSADITRKTHIVEADPATSVAWTTAAVDKIRLGIGLRRE